LLAGFKTEDTQGLREIDFPLLMESKDLLPLWRLVSTFVTFRANSLFEAIACVPG